MADLYLEKKNETFLTLRGEEYILQELDEVYTFFANGYRFHKLYKQKIWDGKIRLLKRKSKTRAEIYCGLQDNILEFCRNRNYSVEYTREKNKIDTKLINDYIDSLNLTTQGTLLTLRDYQIKGIIDGIQNKRHLLLSVTSSGKSVILYSIIRYLLDNSKKCLLLVPNVSLMFQIICDFKDYSSENNFDCDENIHLIYSGQERYTDKPLTISTWQNISALLRNNPDEYLEFLSNFDCIFADEAHLVSGTELTKIFESCINAEYRIGTTGTLNNCLADVNQLIGLIGPVSKLNTTKELINKGQISDIKIKCLVLRYDEKTSYSIKKFTYQNEVKFLVSNKQRNVFIKNLAISMKNNTIILCNYIEHMKMLYELITQSKHLGDRKVYLVYGAIEAERREEIRKLIETEENSIIIGSSAIMGTGISIKSLHNIIFASSGKSKIRTLQSIGRSLRLHESKHHAVLYDICDDLSYKKHTNFSVKHFMERIKLYNQEQFDYKLINVKF
jgi:superfamily II DNA or RNA helicase